MSPDSLVDYGAVEIVYLLSFLLPYKFPYLSFSLRIGSFHFPARGHKRRPNLALLCCVCFVLQCIM